MSNIDPFDLQTARDTYCAVPERYRVLKCTVDACSEQEFLKLLLRSKNKRKKELSYVCVHWTSQGLRFRKFATHTQLAESFPGPLRSVVTAPDIADLYDLKQHGTEAIYFDHILNLCEAMRHFPYHPQHSTCQHFSRLMWELVYMHSGGNSWFAESDPFFRAYKLPAEWASRSHVKDSAECRKLCSHSNPPRAGELAGRIGIFVKWLKLGLIDPPKGYTFFRLHDMYYRTGATQMTVFGTCRELSKKCSSFAEMYAEMAHFPLCDLS